MHGSCQAQCSSYALSNGYTGDFCCAYQHDKSPHACMIGPDGNTAGASGSNWKKVWGIESPPPLPHTRALASTHARAHATRTPARVTTRDHTPVLATTHHQAPRSPPKPTVQGHRSRGRRRHIGLLVRYHGQGPRRHGRDKEGLPGGEVLVLDQNVSRQNYHHGQGPIAEGEPRRRRGPQDQVHVLVLM